MALGVFGAGVLVWQLRAIWFDGAQVADATSQVAEQDAKNTQSKMDADNNSSRSPVAPTVGAGFTRPGDERSLRYRWKSGENYSYDYNYLATVNGQGANDSGRVTYRLGSGKGSQVPTESIESTSTAFVVDPRGYLLTCAHCVKDAKQISVNLNGKKYSGKVLALDAAHDLAVIQINASRLPIVPLGVKRPVELAQDVRAAGHPLSDVLGNSIKITQGSIAGFVEVAGNRLYQVDASINSGNSGGPVFDETGAALGVASAKLEGIDVSNVAFAVPIEFAVPLLEFVGANYTKAIAKEKLGGVELARKVSPAVAFLEVSHSPTRGSVFDLIVNIRQGSNHGSYLLATDESGKSLACDGQEQLPALLGPAWGLALESLPVGNEKQWSTTEQILLSFGLPSRQSAAVYDPFERFNRMRDPFERFGPMTDPFDHLGPRTNPLDRFGQLDGLREQLSPFSSRGRTAGRGQPQADLVTVPAMQTVSYRIEKETPQEVQIRKTVELKTTEANAIGITVALTASGVVRFDPLAGVPAGQEMTGQVEMQVNGETVKISYSYDYDRLIQAGQVRANQPIGDQPKTVEPPAATKPNSTEPTPKRPPASPSSPIASPPDTSKSRQPRAENQIAQSHTDMLVTDSLKAVKNFRAGQIELIQASIACIQLEAVVTMARAGRGRDDRSLPAPDLQDEVRAALRDYIEFSLTNKRALLTGTSHAAIDALGLWGKPDDGELIDRCLTHWEDADEQMMMESSLTALGDFPTRERAERVAAYLGNNHLRFACETSLKKFGSVAEPVVIGLLNESKPDIRRAVVNVLGEIGTRDSTQALNELELKENDALIRSAIMFAKQKIDRRN